MILGFARADVAKARRSNVYVFEAIKGEPPAGRSSWFTALIESTSTNDSRLSVEAP